MSESIKRINILRTIYNAKNDHTNTNVADELKQIKTELKIANDERAISGGSNNSDDTVDAIINTKSPYLEDQPYFKKELLYNSTKETDWKQVRSEEENNRAAYNAQKLRRLNII